MDEKEPDPRRAFSRLIVLSPSTYFQYSVTSSSTGVSLSSALQEVRLDFYDSTSGPMGGETLAPRQPVSEGTPPIIPRAGWGADESLRFQGGQEIWPKQYQRVEKIVVHHTATSNAEADPAATVRGIYRYHAVSRGWGDIGYNFLVDRNGNIYEGRCGGDDVIGGHVAAYNPGTLGVALIGDYSVDGISAKAQQALSQLLAWKCTAKGIDPLGSSNFDDLRRLPNISGHRDLNQTNCPGDTLYRQIPTIRKMVRANMGEVTAGTPGVQIVGVDFYPRTVLVGEAVKVEVKVKSTGTGPVPTQDPNPGMAYNEGDTFNSRGFPKVSNKFRVAVDYDGNQGVSHPYRWGLGSQVNPGDVATVTGYVKFAAPQVRDFWVGVVEEWVKYWDDNEGRATLSVVKSPVAAAQALTDPSYRYFSETRHNLGFGFRTYWERCGGLTQFGLPLTEEFTEISTTDGKPYTTQYFERARFEYHPENKGTPFEVQLGLLGRELTARRDFPSCQAFKSTSDRWYFSEVQHSLSFSFLKYWLTHGGLAIFGYPISEELAEKSATDGKEYTVQYFERNRFEHHPENKGTEFEVQLGQLGRETLLRKGWLT
ncbi:MAG: peptidoglycan recognition protein family protein [Chloroflexi bacterium]|nr:peptidoglycan recognition protein family protein [Chloroflexota bacterium]